MASYLYSIYLTEFGEETRKLGFLKHYLHEDRVTDLHVKEKFPIESFGNPDENLRILGSKTLLEKFEDLDAEKYDFIDSLKNIEYDDINNKKQIILNFPNQEIEAHGIYDFYNDLLTEFQLAKYIDYCISKQYKDLIKINIEQLFHKNGDEEKQFRLIRDKDDSWGIRGLTSTRYRNYDNGIVIYLALLSIHKYSATNNLTFRTNQAYITDSFMHIFFESAEPVNIENVGKVYIGIAISNGEIRNYKFKAELRYRIVDSETQKELSAIYDTPIFSIVHSMNMESIDDHISKIYNLNQYQNTIIDFISNIKNIKVLTEDSAYFLITDLLSNINSCSDISKKTKDAFKQFETDHIINNTLSLIGFFDKASTIPTDLDEEVFIERIFHNVINDLIEKQKNK